MCVHILSFKQNTVNFNKTRNIKVWLFKKFTACNRYTLPSACTEIRRTRNARQKYRWFDQTSTKHLLNFNKLVELNRRLGCDILWRPMNDSHTFILVCQHFNCFGRYFYLYISCSECSFFLYSLSQVVQFAFHYDSYYDTFFI